MHYPADSRERLALDRGAPVSESSERTNEPIAGGVSLVAAADEPTGVAGVLVMAYGTPSRQEDIAAYYTDIRRGRPPTDEQLADLVRRYDAIGGLSPLTERTERQRAAIAAHLEAAAPGRYIVGVGLRHVEPRIETGMLSLLARRVDRVVGIVLAPHYSSMSVAAYLQRASSAAGEHGLAFGAVTSWATEPAYVEFLAGEVAERLATMPAGTLVTFTAHSLPERILAAGDRYPNEVRATGAAVAAALGLDDDAWTVGWQSAGRTPEPWIGPDILAVIDDVAADPDVAGLLVCPCGFVSDHLEVLYDLDIEAAGRAAERGLAFARTATANDDVRVMSALARLVTSTTAAIEA